MYSLVNKLMNLEMQIDYEQTCIRENTTRLIFRKIEGTCSCLCKQINVGMATREFPILVISTSINLINILTELIKRISNLDKL